MRNTFKILTLITIINFIATSFAMQEQNFYQAAKDGNASEVAAFMKFRENLKDARDIMTLSHNIYLAEQALKEATDPLIIKILNAFKERNEEKHSNKWNQEHPLSWRQERPHAMHALYEQ